MVESILEALREAIEDAQGKNQLERDVIEIQEESGGLEEQSEKQTANAEAVED